MAEGDKNHNTENEGSLSTDQMRQQAANWSLAGDTGLRKHLEAFAKRLEAKSLELQKSLNQLERRIDLTNTSIGNVNNQFMLLSHTQFIENRVYDEDEEEQASSLDKTKAQNDAKTGNDDNANDPEAIFVENVTLALRASLNFVDEAFHQVEYCCDSDGEDEVVNLEPIYESSKSYHHRQLPDIIGTTDFMNDDYIGLDAERDTSKLDENESSSEQSSDDDDEVDDDGDNNYSSNREGKHQSNLRKTVESDHSEYSLSEEESDDEISRPTSNKKVKTPSTKSIESRYSSNSSLGYPSVANPSSTKPSPKLKKDLPANATSEFAKPLSSEKNSQLFESDSDDDLFITSAPTTKSSPKVHSKNISNDLKKKAESIASVFGHAKPAIPKPKTKTEKSESDTSKVETTTLDGNSRSDDKLQKVDNPLKSNNQNMGGLNSLLRRSISTEEQPPKSNEEDDSSEIVKNVVNSKTKRSIFDDSDDDDDLFSSAVSSKTSASATRDEHRNSMNAPESASARDSLPSTKVTDDISKDNPGISSKMTTEVNAASVKIESNDAGTISSSTKAFRERSLFSESSDDDMDDLFASVNTSKTIQNRNPSNQAPEKELSIEDESSQNTEGISSEIESSQKSPSKSPMFGGVSLFGNMGGDISAAIKARNQKTPAGNDTDPPSVPQLPSAPKPSNPMTEDKNENKDQIISKIKPSMPSSIFDDSDDEDDLFASITTEKSNNTSINSNSVVNAVEDEVSTTTKNESRNDDKTMKQSIPELPKIAKPVKSIKDNISSVTQEETTNNVATEAISEVIEDNEVEKQKSKKPFGGVSMFGAGGIDITKALQNPMGPKQTKMNNTLKKDLFSEESDDEDEMNNLFSSTSIQNNSTAKNDASINNVENKNKNLVAESSEKYHQDDKSEKDPTEESKNTGSSQNAATKPPPLPTISKPSGSDKLSTKVPPMLPTESKHNPVESPVDGVIASREGSSCQNWDPINASNADKTGLLEDNSQTKGAKIPKGAIPVPMFGAHMPIQNKPKVTEMQESTTKPSGVDTSIQQKEKKASDDPDGAVQSRANFKAMLNAQLGKKINPVSPIHIDREPSSINVDTIPMANDDWDVNPILPGNSIQSSGAKGDIEEITSDQDNSFLGVKTTQILDVSSMKSKPKANPKRRMPTKRPKSKAVPIFDLGSTLDDQNKNSDEDLQNKPQSLNTSDAPLGTKVSLADDIDGGMSTKETMSKVNQDSPKSDIPSKKSNIFDDDSDDDLDDLFSSHKVNDEANEINSTVNSEKSEGSNTKEREAEISAFKKKPIGGISLFGNGGLDLTKALKKSTEAKASTLTSTSKMTKESESNDEISELASESISVPQNESSLEIEQNVSPVSHDKSDAMSTSSDSNELFGTTIPPMPDNIGSSTKDSFLGSPGESNSQDDDSSDDLFSTN